MSMEKEKDVVGSELGTEQLSGKSKQMWLALSGKIKKNVSSQVKRKTTRDTKKRESENVKT
jgi:hypothetical protein